MLKSPNISKVAYLEVNTQHIKRFDRYWSGPYSRSMVNKRDRIKSLDSLHPIHVWVLTTGLKSNKYNGCFPTKGG